MFCTIPITLRLFPDIWHSVRKRFWLFDIPCTSVICMCYTAEDISEPHTVICRYHFKITKNRDFVAAFAVTRSLFLCFFAALIKARNIYVFYSLDIIK